MPVFVLIRIGRRRLPNMADDLLNRDAEDGKILCFVHQTQLSPKTCRGVAWALERSWAVRINLLVMSTRCIAESVLKSWLEFDYQTLYTHHHTLCVEYGCILYMSSR